MRRAYLAGDTFDHRKLWIEERLQLLARCFAVEVAGYAVMSNHVHVIMRMQPSQPQEWSADEVVRRWRSAFPKKTNKDGTAQLPTDVEIAVQAMDTLTVEKWRKRLSNVGYFMKAFKEPISRRANKEDGCSGAFWEGRYHSQVLLDQAALIACMAYIDLNPIRAKITDRPETSQFTSAYRRIGARNRHRAAQEIITRQPRSANKVLAAEHLTKNLAHAEIDLWLTPMKNCVVGEPLANKRFTPDEYLTLLDATGRLLKSGKRGAIPPELAPILQRLDLSVDAWLATMLGWRMFALGTAIGQAKTRLEQAASFGVQWLRNSCPLFPRDNKATALSA